MTKIKVCGLSRLEDIAAVNRLLPDYAGFVMAESRRRVDVKTAAMLKERLDPRIKAVGVFVNANMADVAEMYRNGVIDLAQLHGDEDGGYIGRLKDKCDCPVIKAVGVGGAPPLFPAGCDYLLFDTLTQQRGGAGRTFDWHIIKGYRGPPFFLSGGLTAENAPDAIRLLAPFCADVSSGVETDGIKDMVKIEKFIEAVRGMH